MIDLRRTVDLVRGALVEPEPTWRAYLPDAGDWKKTAALLTGPLIIAAAVIAYLVGLLRSDASFMGMFRPTLLSTIGRIVAGAIAAGVFAFIFSWMAGIFKGKRDFALGLAATTLAFVPGYLGQALIGVPWIGSLLMLGLMIYGLILLWRIIPIYLGVPDGSRAGHYIVSLLASIIVMIVLSAILGALGFGPGDMNAARSYGGPESGESTTGGVFGGMARQAELVEAAENDTYAPPKDGKLRERQVQEFIRIMDRTAEIQGEKEQRYQEIAKKAEDEEDISMRDFGQMLGGMAELAGLQTAEIEVVKTGGGNWAEHQWIRSSLRTAWLQKDLNEAVQHNYALYQKYESELKDYVTR